MSKIKIKININVNWIGLEKKIAACTFLQMSWIGQILIRICVTRSSVEMNENWIVTSQWKSSVTSLVACLPQHVYIVVQHHVGKQMTRSYVCNYRRSEGSNVPLPIVCKMVQSLMNLLILKMSSWRKRFLGWFRMNHHVTRIRKILLYMKNVWN